MDTPDKEYGYHCEGDTYTDFATPGSEKKEIDLTRETKAYMRGFEDGKRSVIPLGALQSAPDAYMKFAFEQVTKKALDAIREIDPCWTERDTKEFLKRMQL